MYKVKKTRYSICSKKHTTGKYCYHNKDCVRSKNFKQDYCKMQKVVYKCFQYLLDHTTTSVDCFIKKAKNTELREFNVFRC